ncbi:hypothetical protein G7K_1902-t1 [Saitoella complicata NRRL Y-17804]|uniref:Uncharacterized protein n=1 Tax=Saitoella complicata (strain BCRC 22490 / CBS 7301 / JCM 7358 / NBRC 10748 / NRRL Y-17804) TaxID=698492 RepID=A0A0E9ND24_SAICN|nr:hypothetical protein G7K_1902-t1 [Saitoella complicata NRRL Y-17804]
MTVHFVTGFTVSQPYFVSGLGFVAGEVASEHEHALEVRNSSTLSSKRRRVRRQRVLNVGALTGNYITPHVTHATRMTVRVLRGYLIRDYEHGGNHTTPSRTAKTAPTSRRTILPLVGLPFITPYVDTTLPNPAHSSFKLTSSAVKTTVDHDIISLLVHRWYRVDHQLLDYGHAEPLERSTVNAEDVDSQPERGSFTPRATIRLLSLRSLVTMIVTCSAQPDVKRGTIALKSDLIPLQHFPSTWLAIDNSRDVLRHSVA